jgi:hypothetical protein
MGERSTAGSICDTCPVDVNNKVHKDRGTAKHARQNQSVKHRNCGHFRAYRNPATLFTTWIHLLRCSL